MIGLPTDENIYKFSVDALIDMDTVRIMKRQPLHLTGNVFIITKSMPTDGYFGK